MPESLQSLLLSSAQAAKDGRTAESWRIMHRFATEYWLEEPTEPLGEYYALRAGAADCLGMADEAVGALRDMKAWAEQHDPIVAFIARAHLAYQSMNAETKTEQLPDAFGMLKELEQDLAGFGEPAGQTEAGKLVLAATTAYTVASNLEDTSLAPRFAGHVRRFGTKAPSEADRQLWLAQEYWTLGRRNEARELARKIPEMFPDNIIARFEAYDMQAHFDLMESLEDFNDREGIAKHWAACANIAITLQAPLIALRRTELACRGLMGFGNVQRAFDLASEMLDAMGTAPMSPAMLELTAVRAEAAFELGDFSTALAMSQGTAEWLEMNHDLDSAVQCYTIAALSSIQLGHDAIDLQVRRAQLLVNLKNFMTAGQAYLALALATDEEHYLDTAWETLAQDTAHPDHLWLVAEAHLTSAAVFMNNGKMTKADKSMALAEELVRSLPEAEDLDAELEDLKQRRNNS